LFLRGRVKIDVQARFDLYGTMKRDGNWYVAYCPPLDIATQGKTAEQARENLVEAATLFLASCLERGTLDQALKELGFIPLGKARSMPRGAFPLAIPLPFGFEKAVECRA
jgi:predicted RNase H-like HicB family nuclease